MARLADFDKRGHFAYDWIRAIECSGTVLLDERGRVNPEKRPDLTLHESLELLG